MSYRVSKDGVTIQVDSENEFKVVIDALQLDAMKTKASAHQLTDDSIYQALNDFFNSLSIHTNQYKALIVLKNNPNGLTATQLMQQMDLTTLHALGGTLGNITKNAKKFGLRSSDIYTTNTKLQQLTYRLTEKMSAVVENALK
ncbi:MAG: hypothetical protein AB2L11_09800 [Syntrophobacteraceae bacterium]